jgi:hypothetical protein
MSFRCPSLYGGLQPLHPGAACAGSIHIILTGFDSCGIDWLLLRSFMDKDGGDTPCLCSREALELVQNADNNSVEGATLCGQDCRFVLAVARVTIFMLVPSTFPMPTAQK